MIAVLLCVAALLGCDDDDDAASVFNSAGRGGGEGRVGVVTSGGVGAGSGVLQSETEGGATLRIDAFLNIGSAGPLRHMLGMGLGYEEFRRPEPTRYPSGLALEVGRRDASHIWAQPGYELWWFIGEDVQLALRGALCFGVQRFSGPAADGWQASYGLAVGPELRIGFRDRFGFRLGAEWAPQSLARSFIGVNGRFDKYRAHERALEHVARAYAGVFFGFASRPQ